MGVDLTAASGPTRIVVAQGAVTLVMTGGFLLADTGSGVSSLLAGLAVVVPNAYFARRVLVQRERREPLEAARALMGNSVVKLLLSMALLGVIFSSYPVEPLGFFATFIVVHAVHVIAPLVDGPPRSRRKGV